MVYQRKRHNKRWWLNGSATLPYIGKTNLSIGNEKSKLVRRGLVKLIKTTVNKQAEKKHREIDTIGPVGMTANTHYDYNPLGAITIGTSELQRVGDKIRPMEFKANLRFVASTNDNTHYVRVMLLKNNQQFGSGVSAFATNFSSVDIYYTGNDTNRTFIDTTNQTVCFDKIVRVEKQTTSAQTSKIIKIRHKFTGPFQYMDGSDYAKTGNYYVIVAATRDSATTGTTVVGDIYMSSILTFVDL